MFRLFIAILAIVPNLVWAEKRVALIIGNNAYAEVSTLQKAVADAEAVASKMEAAGYQTILSTDVDRRDTNLAISRFTALLEPGDTAFVFYAGHGVEIEGENYLLPTDIAAPEGVSEGFIRSESIPLSGLLQRIRGTGARTTLAIVDACRDNPFNAKNGRSIGGTRGLARIAAPEGTFVMFSAGAGQQALDRLSDTDTNRNSVFTRALLPKLEQEGLELRDMIFDLREEVRDLAKSRNHQQFPAYYDELLGDFYLNPVSVRAVAPEPAAPQPAPQLAGNIRADFELARSLGTEAAFKRFIEAYADHPDQFVVSVARDMLAALAPAEAKPENPKPSLTPAPKISDARSIMRATQTELNRLGCNAGGADGVAGQRTRTAFAAFLSANKVNLRAADLGSSQALSALKSATRKCAAPVAAKPTAPTLAGSWSYSSACPFNIRSTGSARYRQTGGNSFSGTWQDSFGIKGTLSVRLNGRQFSSTVRWSGGTATENGTLSSSGRSYTSTTSTGCQIRANRLN